MAGISSYDSNSISTLLSSLPVYNGSAATQNLLTGINLSDYSCIKSGSYYKLMKAYFKENEVESVGDKNGLSTSKDSDETLSEIKSSSNLLAKNATELYKDSSIYEDEDKLLDRIKSLVSDYNKVLETVGKAETDSIARAGANLINYTNTNSSILEKVGIKINEKDYSLSIEEERFKNANKSSLESLFKGTGSFAYGLGVKASMIESYAQREAGKSNTYGSNGNYTDNYSTGNILNSFF